MNLAAALVETSSRQPAQIAVRLGEAALTYGDLDRRSALVAGVLRARGLQPGEPVGVMLPNVPDFAVIYYGVLRAGGIVVPMNPLLKAREVGYYLTDSGARLMFAWHGVVEEPQAGAKLSGAEVVAVNPTSFDTVVLAAAEPVFDVAEREGSDTAVLLYTSGTTGQPKGAELSHANLVENAKVCAHDLLSLSAQDVLFAGLPLFHAFGQTCTLNAAVRVGATLTMLPRFDPAAALAIIGAHRVTVLSAVPTMYSALLASHDPAVHDVSSLRAATSGGAALPVEVLRAFEEAFDCPVLEGYGLSETSPVASFNHLDRPRKPGSIGTPVRGVQMRVMGPTGFVAPGEVGEIEIRGHNVMKGYWRRPEATAEAIVDGWFRSGDLGTVDEDGFFSVVGRKKELIIRGGYNVYPRELEEVLYEHPAVAEAAVIGVAHPELGEEVAAAVALKPDATATADELRRFVADRVAAYKYPRLVWLVDELPKNATGKVQKRDVVPPPGLTP